MIPTFTLALSLLVHSPVAQEVPPSVQQLLETHCIECHSEDKPKGGLDLTEVLEDGAEADLGDWRLIDRVVTSGEMPPEGEPAPTDSDRERMISDLQRWTRQILQAMPERPGTVSIRRLGRKELKRTIRDLTGVELDVRRHLPADPSSEGFDNQGGAFSIDFVERLFRIAEEVSISTVFTGAAGENPETTYEVDQMEISGAGNVRSSSAFFFSRGTASIQHFFPRTGSYTLHLEGWGQQAGDQPVRFQVRIGDLKARTLEFPESREQPGQRKMEIRVPTGSHKITATFINDYFEPDHPEPSQRDRNAGLISFRIEGPEEGLEASHFQRQALAGDGTPRQRLERGLHSWLPRFWRGPVATERIEEVARIAHQSAMDPESAESLLRSALIIAIVSPRFILRLEEDPADAVPGTVRNLSGHEIATRLSYFLWGTTPDTTLLEAASSGQLDDTDGLLEQTRRLLASPRSRSLSSDFATQWLRIIDLDDRRPDPKIFSDFDRQLLSSMRKESIEFFDHVMRHKAPVEELISASYSFINPQLSRHYGLGPLEGKGFRKVEIDHPRGGGLLSQGSILLATSTRQRTSPVLRGKWLLEVLLDAAPPPPPPGAGTLPAPGEEGAQLSLREQLRLHRREPSCGICHRRMDALGFSMERMGATGKYRTTDVDDRGELPDGSVLDGVPALKAAITSDRGFRRSLARNLLTYALGRGLTDEDAPAVARLLDRLQLQPTVVALIEEIVQLEAFRRRSMP